MNKLIRILLIVLIAISALFGLMFYFGGDIPGTEGQPIYTQLFIVWAYILLAFSVILSVVFPIIHMILNPKNIKKSLLGFLAIAVLVFIAYLFASTDSVRLAGEGTFDDVSVLKYVGTGIISMYFLSGIAILSIFYTEIAKMFK
ncbi:MAG: hypothetical protein PF487_10935 [Bacteroidales bacterium]|jgi:hypothetical protein|nr:hypothetical protein [Bacteroidales bacterium]